MNIAQTVGKLCMVTKHDVCIKCIQKWSKNDKLWYKLYNTMTLYRYRHISERLLCTY